MKSWYEERKDLYKNQPKAKVEHQTGKDVVAVGTLVASGGLAGVTKVKKGLNFVEELVTVVKKKGVKETVKSFVTLIDDKIKVIGKEILYSNQKETFLNFDYVTAETLQDIKTYRRFGGNANLGGSYVSTAEKLSREELALVTEFNNSMRFEAIIKIPKGEKINIGKVGPWPPKAPEFMGGADQVILKYNYPENVWVQSIKDLKTGKIYSYGDFKKAYPNLCK